MNPTHTPILARQDLQYRLDTLARVHRIPGAQLVVDTGSEVVAVHTGIADVATGTPFTADTAVPLGSLTKPWTAALVLLLADDGDLDLDDSVAEYLPEFRDVPEVTVRQLLSHTSGLPCGPDSDTAARTTATRYLSAACAAGELLFTPGTDFSYSNAGYVAAGRLAETVTGMPWHEAVGTLLLEPMGVLPAYIGLPAGARPVATGHAFNTATGATRPVRQNLAPLEAPAGALLASAIDLSALGRALAGQSLFLPPSVVKHMSQADSAAEPGALADGWGLGLALFRHGGQLWCGHDGNAQGTSCHLRVEPDSGVVVAFTGNAGAATALWRDLAEDLAGIAGISVPAAIEPLNARALPAPRDCAGLYTNGSTHYRVALEPGGSPTLSVDGDLPLPLVCYPDLSCDLVDPATGRREPGGRFHRDPRSGVVDRVQISGRTARRVVPA